MEIMVARHSGFCEGVERAYKIALEQVESGGQVFMLGNLVHNAQVVDKLKKLGVRTVKSISEIPRGANGKLIVSAHGVPPDIYDQAKAAGLEIVDTTCPWVKKAQKIAKELSDGGKKVIIVGDKGHPEVAGLVGWSGGRAMVVEKIEDVNGLSINPGDRIGILAQTTQAEAHFKQMAAEVKKRASDVKEFDTICGATSKRQDAAVEAAKKVDLMLVVGDKMSANTKRLAELCSKTGTETHQIQTVEELNKSWLNGRGKIGVTAGASTPEWIVDRVISLLRSFASAQAHQ